MEVWERINMIIAGIKPEYDPRSKKPIVSLWDWDEFGYTRAPENWLLNTDYSEMLITKPNDVAIYSSIARKKLIESKLFFDNNVKTHQGNPLAQFIDNKAISATYYDYFESLITAIIFSYTSIETFANICIPEDYEYHDEKKDIKYGARHIERNFHIREKLKFCLPEILGTPNVVDEPWWNKFTELEDIRNEIIHSKPSKSEERFSKMLTERIFVLIGVNEEIINYYGGFIKLNSPSLLDEFPFDFGYDEFSESYISKKSLTGLMDLLNHRETEEE